MPPGSAVAVPPITRSKLVILSCSALGQEGVRADAVGLSAFESRQSNLPSWGGLVKVVEADIRDHL